MSRPFSLKERLASFRFAAAGLRKMLLEEHNARLHLASTLVVLIVGVTVGLRLDEWRWIVLAITLVWAAETFNCAVERLSDAVSIEHNARIGAAKDMAAAAVLLVSIAAAIIGLTIFVPHFIRLAAA